MRMWLFLFREQWYRCITCGYNFPGSEISAHEGHKFYPIAGQ